MDEGFHRVLHFGAFRRGNLDVIDLHITLRHLVETLVDNAETLTHLMHSAEISVKTVSIHANWNVKVNRDDVKITPNKRRRAVPSSGPT